MHSGLKQAIAREIDGQRAKSHVVEIVKYHRGLGSTGYRQAGEYLISYLRSLGLEVGSVDSPLDNETRVGSYTNPYAWEPVDAILRVIEPEVRTLVSFNETPTCIRSWSGSTGPEGVTAEIVHVGSGVSESDYEGIDVRGKIVFCDHGMDWRVHPLAVEKHGALGFVSDHIRPIPPFKTRETFPDAALWFTLAERQLDGTMNKGWGLSISPRQGDRLRDLLSQGPVRVWAKVDTKMFSGMMENPLATIEGSLWPDEEVLLVAHLCHTRPAAVDNAAGCAHITEVARTLKALIDRGQLPRPKRSIRFLYGPEGHCGNVYFQQNVDRLDGIHVSLCSHVGGDPEQLKGPLVMMRATCAVPTYIDDLCEDVLDEVVSYFPTPGLPVRVDAYGQVPPVRHSTNPFAWLTVPRFMGGDSIQNNAWGIPSVEMSRKPNIFWHTIYDTPDKTSVEEFEKLGWVYAVLAHTIADAGYETALDLMKRVESRAIRRMGLAGQQAREELAGGGDAATWIDRLSYLAERDGSRVQSSLKLAAHEPSERREELERMGRKLAGRLAQAATQESECIRKLASSAGRPVTVPAASERDGRRPVRTGLGLVDMKFITTRIAGKFSYDSLELLGYLYEVLNLCDGTNTVDDVARALRHELGFADEATVRQMVSELAQLEVITLGDDA